MRLFGLLGYPLTHSFSQKYFSEKFLELGIQDASYENFSFSDIEGFRSVLKSKKELAGFNITIPYKKEIIRLIDEQSDPVKKMGACNCVKVKDGKLIGYNTDVVGFQQSLKPFLKPHHKKALILGTGGASAAVAYAFDALNIEFQYVSRNSTEHAIAYHALNQEMLKEYLLIVNTTPLGMYPNLEDCPDIPYEYLSEKHHCYDLIYNPAETKFLMHARQKGASIQNGYEMLLLQAEESWRIWNE